MTPTRDDIDYDALLASTVRDIEIATLGRKDGLVTHTIEQAQSLVDAIRTLRDQREANARTCVWSPDDDEYCPGTWDGACGAKWTFTEGGVVDNDMHYCPQCGGKVTVAAMPAQGEK